MAIVVLGGIALLGLAPQSEGTSTDTVTLPLQIPVPADTKLAGASAESSQQSVNQRTDSPAIASLPDDPVYPAPISQVELLEEIIAPQEAEEIAYSTETAKVGRGESLYYIFKKQKLDQAELMMLLKAKPHGRRLERLMPGQILEFTFDDSRSLVALDLTLDQTRTLKFFRRGAGFESELIEVPLERRSAHAAGHIEDSLFLAGQQAGLSNRVIMELVEIFGWDIDFALDIRSGDSFLVMFDELFKNGEKVGEGNILAAEFINQKQVYRAVRYEDPNGRASYFSPDGTSMRKAFLRTPVKFGRVSSRFNLKRRHPILHRIRAHRGVDYAAAPGTPVRATGDGKIIYVGRKGGYGRTVILRHGSTYSTLYAHLRGYAKGVRSGKRVQQGQVIGYVGRSGLATGPHLHYEFRVRGRHRNPLTVKLPKAAPVPKELKDDFELKTRDLVAQLDVLSKTRIALSD
ncbi:MAG TPA: peptidoglycan DD-metalloendopeptidase family protein [Gammaproteobacteria bacterium]|nr:peptidoglycan DD-metalloendopeptidase family protein [Gammaproteobacteria bacterium]